MQMFNQACFFLFFADFLKVCLLIVADDSRRDDFDSAFDELNSPQKKKPSWQAPKESGVNLSLIHI